MEGTSSVRDGVVQVAKGPRAVAADRWLILALLTAVYTVNIADRFIVSILMEPIKRDFALSDSMIGFLTGTVMATFYILAIIPVGVLTDRLSRKWLLVTFAAIFSVMTALSGLTRTIMLFAGARLLVGMAEAGTSPPSISLLSDRFSASRRAMAMTIFTLGAALGGALGSFCGGWLSDAYGWRMTLVIFGALGLPLVAAVALLIREPARGALDAPGQNARSPLADSLRFMWEQRSLVHLVAGATVITFWGWGLLWWAPAFLSRTFGVSVGRAGSLLGSVHMIAGTGGILATVLAMRWLADKDPRLQMQFIAVCTAAGTVPSIAANLLPSLSATMAMFWLFVPVVYLYFGPNFGMVNNLVPAPMRGQAIAVYLFATNFANLAAAPQVVGWMSDALTPFVHSSRDSLRYALVGVALCGFWGSYHFWVARRHVRHDLARVARWTARDDRAS